MGPSGSGKSTLLNLIAGLDRPTSGEVWVGGDRVDKLSETGLARFRRRQVGMIFQFFNLLDDMTVADNIALPAQLAGLPVAKTRARVDELLAALRIGPHRDAYPARLSGGERQRVAIARALVNRPALLLADEPTGALDTATGEEIGELLLDLNSSGQTLVLVTHNPDLASQVRAPRDPLVDGQIASDADPRMAGPGDEGDPGPSDGPGRARWAGRAPRAGHGDRPGGPGLHRGLHAGARPARRLQRPLRPRVRRPARRARDGRGHPVRAAGRHHQGARGDGGGRAVRRDDGQRGPPPVPAAPVAARPAWPSAS